MSSNIVLSLVVPESADVWNDGFMGTKGGTPLTATYFGELANFFSGVPSSMARLTSIKVGLGAVAATGTFVGTGVVATDFIVIAGQTLTCVNSGATTDQFNKGATDTLTMASLAAKINAHAFTSLYVSAASVGTTLTLTAVIPGITANAITLSADGSHLVAGAARMASGSEGSVSSTTYSVNNY